MGRRKHHKGGRRGILRGGRGYILRGGVFLRKYVASESR